MISSRPLPELHQFFHRQHENISCSVTNTRRCVSKVQQRTQHCPLWPWWRTERIQAKSRAPSEPVTASPHAKTRACGEPSERKSDLCSSRRRKAASPPPQQTCIISNPAPIKAPRAHVCQHLAMQQHVTFVDLTKYYNPAETKKHRSNIRDRLYTIQISQQQLPC